MVCDLRFHCFVSLNIQFRPLESLNWVFRLQIKIAALQIFFQVKISNTLIVRCRLYQWILVSKGDEL